MADEGEVGGTDTTTQLNKYMLSKLPKGDTSTFSDVKKYLGTLVRRFVCMLAPMRVYSGVECFQCVQRTSIMNGSFAAWL